jgi:UDP-GlcNAc3NAcA epimerase
MQEPLRILTIVGTRPQIIKAAALSRAVRGRFAGRIVETILHTGQHYDARMSQDLFGELGISPAGIDLAVGSGYHGATTARMIEGIEQVLLRREHDIVVLYGDTNSTLAGALAAAKLQVPIAHIEAGLRSFNKRMPEEINRIVCDHCSSWLFCPTDTAVSNLVREGFPPGSDGIAGPDHPVVVNCGDVMYDNSLHFSDRAIEHSTMLKELGLSGQSYLLATVHRDFNTDDAVRANAIFGALLQLQERHGLPVVIPVHPRTHRMMGTSMDPELLRSLSETPGIHLLPPCGYLDMLVLERNARLILTDSGGVQKEAYFFRKPCVVLRNETEWVELVENGQATLADADVSRILSAADRYLITGAPACPPLFGDGRAAEHICEQLLQAR